MIYNKHNEEHELYIKALKSLDQHNAVSDHVKVAETPEEVAFMRETHAATSRNMFGLNMSETQYNLIFGEKTA